MMFLGESIEKGSYLIESIFNIISEKNDKLKIENTLARKGLKSQ